MPPLITSLQNERVKNAVKLRDRRGRDKQQRIVIDGVREIGRALQSGVAVEAVFVCDDFCDADSHGLARSAAAAGAEILPVTAPVMEKLVFGERAAGLLAIARPPQTTLDDLARQLELVTSPLSKERRTGTESPTSASPFIAVLEGVEKPGNLGAVLRTADAAGVSAVVVAGGGTDLYNPNAIRASLGAVFTLPVCAAETSAVLTWLRKHRFQIWTAKVDAAADYATAAFNGRCALVLGSEAHGLTAAWKGPDVHAVALPMLGKVDSLNVSATAAVLFYEALRQRRIGS